MDDPGALGPQSLERLGQRPHPPLGEHADHLALRAGRAGDGPQQVEDGPKAQLCADRRDVAHGPVVRRGEHEADAGLVQRPQLALLRRVQVNPEFREDVGRTGFRRQGPVAMLGHLQPAARRDEPHGGGDVQRVQPVAARAADVDGRIGRVDPHGRLSHRAGAGHDLAQGLAAQAHGGQRGAHLGRRWLSAQAGGEEGVSVVAGQGRAVGQSREQRLEGVGHGGPVRPPPAASPRRGRGSWPAVRGHTRWRWIRGGTARHAPAATGAGSP